MRGVQWMLCDVERCDVGVCVAWWGCEVQGL